MNYGKILSPVLFFFACFPFGARAQTSTIALVQHASRDAGTATSATLAFNSTNTAGNWIGVCVRAGRSGEIFTVTDSKGNAYHRAVQFNVTVDTPNGHTLGIFYAENIAGGANTITVSDTISATMRFAVVEYSGVATANSLDVIAMAQGNGVSPNSGSVTTSNGDLFLGAISTANSASFTAGSGFSAVDSVPAEPGTKLFAEQQINTLAGAESALATLGAPDSWGAILAGFKRVAGAATIPNITSISPVSGSVGTAVTITGTNFGTAVGTVTFNGTAATPTSWSATRVVAPVPSGATTGNVVLTDPGVASNGVPFTVTTPDTTPPVVAITSPANNATLSGTTTITANATDNVAVASVQFKVDSANTGAAVVSAPYSIALDTTLLSNGNHILTAVATDTSGNATTSAAVTVKVNNLPAAPVITSLSPASGAVGSPVTIAGANFGITQGTSSVTFSGIAATTTSWSATTVSVNVPTGATTGSVIVTVGGVASNSLSFTVTIPVPSIASLNPASGLVGASITITGTNLGATRGASTVTFNGTAGTPTSWSATSIAVPVPAGATTGNVVVTVGGVASNGMSFTVAVPAPSITSLSPSSGLVGSSVTISGANFGATQGTSALSFNGVAGTPTSWSATSIAVPVPAGATTGNVVVTVGGVASNGVSFTVTTPGPNITNLSPTSGLVSTPVTISGANFGATQGSSTVSFGGVAAAATSWSATSIVVPVPAGATTGNVVATVGGVASNGVSFTVTVPAPSVTSLNPASGLVGASVTITGTNLGATQGTSTVTFNGTTGTPTSWSATSIVVPVPTGATTGNVVVTVGGAASNGVSFTVTIPSPSITSLSPSSGSVGTPVTITGANFGTTQGTSTLTFNGIAAAPASWSAASIVVPVPTGATTGNVVVTTGGVASNGVGFTLTASAPMALVQHTSTDAGTTTSATLAFLSNNTAGNWIGVSIRAGHSGQVFTVTDSRGNVYRKAVLFNVSVDAPNGDTLGIYYAENIAGGPNTITVSDTISGTLRFAIVEYSGVATANSLDVAAAAQGTSASPNSGNVLTTLNGDLLLGAIMTGNPATYTVGIGNVIRESVPAEPNTKLMVEDQFQPSAGTVSASASLGAGDNWGAALAAFKAVSGGANPSPAGITSLSPSSGLVGTSVTISGANFGATQGASTVKFNGTAATPTSWSATSIVAPVPAGATTGNVVVTVGGVASNGVSFTVTVPPPSITSLNPTSGFVGTSVTISGANFGGTQGTSTVKFNGTAATPTGWSATSIVAQVPTGATTGNVVVTVGGVASNGASFTVQTDTTPPVVTITAPANNATVSGTITLTATATDPDSPVSFVQFLVDGANVGGQLTTAPYSLSLNTTTLSNGAHSLTAVGQDPSGNVGTSVAVSITVSNTTSAIPTLIYSTAVPVAVPAGGSWPQPPAPAPCNFSTPCYRIPLPELTTAGSTLIMAFSYDSTGANQVFSVTDDKSNTWVLDATSTASNNKTMRMYRASNIAAGASYIQIQLTGGSQNGYWQASVAEFYNVGTLDGSSCNAAGSATINAGNITPTASGDLIFQAKYSTSVTSNNLPPVQTASFSAGAQANITWSLASQLLGDGVADQYGVYNSTATLNPTFTQAASDNYISCAVALKVAASGSASTAIPRVLHQEHDAMPHNAPNPWRVGLVADAPNVAVYLSYVGNDSITNVTSSPAPNIGWTASGADFQGQNGHNHVNYYCAKWNTPPGTVNLSITRSASSNDSINMIYVVQNGTCNLDVDSGGQAGFKNDMGPLPACANCLTPTHQNDIIFANGGQYDCTAIGLIAPTGGIFDSAFFTGNTIDGPSQTDENNFWMHYYNGSNLGPISVTWNEACDATTQYWAGRVVAYQSN